jgi:hypothetical protein
VQLLGSKPSGGDYTGIGGGTTDASVQPATATTRSIPSPSDVTEPIDDLPF